MKIIVHLWFWLCLCLPYVTFIVKRFKAFVYPTPGGKITIIIMCPRTVKDHYLHQSFNSIKEVLRYNFIVISITIVAPSCFFPSSLLFLLNIFPSSLSCFYLKQATLVQYPGLFGLPHPNLQIFIVVLTLIFSNFKCCNMLFHIFFYLQNNVL